MITASQTAKRLTFCYFSPRSVDYVPLDMGFVAAIIERAHPREFDVKMLPLTYEYRDHEEQQRRDIDGDCTSILENRPDAVFLCIENVLWSKVFALGRATKIATELRARNRDLFIGFQSYKIQPSQVTRLFEREIADCVIAGDPEPALVNVGEILDGHDVPGVVLPGRKTTPVNGCGECRATDRESELDGIPSPYLNRVFDDFLKCRQEQRENAFRAFLASSRGCGFGCYYCFRSVKFDRVRLFSARRFFDEMEYLLGHFGVRNFFVLDDAFLYSKDRLRAFVEEFRLRRRINGDLGNVRLFMMARPESIDEDVVTLLSELQTVWVQIGLQTVKTGLQHYMNRKVGVEHFKRIAALFHEHRIGLYIDVIMGLPEDTLDAFKETFSYALSLKPAFMQVKQFYLNPNTLFFLQQDRYEIELESKERDFDVPYVVRAKGVDDRYFSEASDYVMQQIERHTEVSWKFLSQKKRFVSPRFGVRSSQPLSP